ncbi:MAG TPA: hypothetical protein DCE41_31090 [Cytophagales bacterium]|nr:hypothetical protein [Cytophagales bacterium]HAA18485.1 hypothetical protein [Cytophagales bacterium]
MSKSEKRNFRLYATRNSGEKELKFLALFTALDAQTEYDEAALLQKVNGVNKRQLSNLKAHLYQQLLASLRLLYKRVGDLELRELLDFATVLYEKGLFLQSLDQLAKARVLAIQRNRQSILMEVLEFEKMIEARHITRSHAERATELIQWGQETRSRYQADEAWSDLALEMYGLYLRMGHVKNQTEYDYVEQYFLERLPQDSTELSFFGEVYKAQAYVWCHFTLQNWRRCYRYAKRWVQLFLDHPKFQTLELDLFIKGLHNLLSVLYYNMDRTRFYQYFALLEEIVEERKEDFNENGRIYAFIYTELARINMYFLEANFAEGVAAIPHIEQELVKYQDRVDEHRVFTFWYQFACLYFAQGQYREAIKYLQRIVNSPKLTLREDIQVFARLLKLIAHYELGDRDHVDAQIRSVYRFLLKFEHMQDVQKAVMDFLKESVYMNRDELTPHFRKLQTRLETIAQNPYQRRPFLYLDLYTYLRTKIEGLSMEEAVKLRVSEGTY